MPAASIIQMRDRTLNRDRGFGFMVLSNVTVVISPSSSVAVIYGLRIAPPDDDLTMRDEVRSH